MGPKYPLTDSSVMLFNLYILAFFNTLYFVLNYQRIIAKKINRDGECDVDNL